MSFYHTEDFQKKCEVFGICLTEEQTEKFMDYYELLIEWNSFMNLTAITDFDEVILKHFVDSLAIYQIPVFKNRLENPAVKMSGQNDSVKNNLEDIMLFNNNKQEKSCNVSLIDVGTGAGFPGIPLKIVFPEIRVMLLDSLNKRVKFLNTVIDRLNLKDIEEVHGRAEDLARREEYREQYDFCVSRAVANLSTLTELCIPFVKMDGYFISYKSEKISEEYAAGKKAIDILGGKLEDILEYQLPDSDISRSLLIIKKEKNTPKKYPRKAGTPAREPLF